MTVSKKLSDRVLGEIQWIETSDRRWWKACIGSDVGISIEMARDALGPSEAILHQVRKLYRSKAEFNRNIKEFLAEEARDNRADSEDVSQLSVESIVFNWPSKPAYAEIYFGGAPSGRLWTCGFEDGRLFTLSVSG